MVNKSGQQKIPRGYKETRLGLIPKDWQTKHLSEIASIASSNVDKKTKKQETPVRLCNYTDVYANEYIHKNMPFMEASATKNEIAKFSLRKSDVIITKDSEDRMDIAVPAYVTESMNGVLCGYHLAILRPKEELLDGLYLSKILQLNEINHHFVRRANGVTRFGLTVSTIENSRIHLPPLEEQRHISKILTTWDEAITKTQKLISAKRKFKKALMQQLLTGKHRFKEFQGRKWKSATLADLLNPQFRRVSKPSEPYLALGIRSFGNGTFQKPAFNPNDIALKELYKVKKDDLIVNITFAWEGAIAVVGKSDDGALVSHRFPTYEFNREIVIPEYFRHVILQKRFIHELGLVSPGGAGRNRVLSKKDFLKRELSIPPLKEQYKIGTLLNAVDKEIEQLNQQHELLKQQKRGLMQKLLTGKIRVKV